MLPFPTDQIRIISADIREGGLALTLSSDMDLKLAVELRLDDLTDRDGDPIEFEIPEVRRTDVPFTFNLDDTEFAPLDPLELRLSYSARTLQTTEPTHITSGGKLTVVAAPDTLKFSKVQGTLDRLTMPIPPVTQDIPDVPEGLENLELATTSLVAWLTSKVGFKSEIELFVEGENAAGDRVDFTVRQTFERFNSDADPPDGKVIEVPLDPTDVTAFLNLLPNTITVSPKVQVGDGVGVETVTPTDWVRVDSVIFGSEAKFRIRAEDRIEVAPQHQELADEEARKRISNNLQRAAVVTKIINHIPLGVKVSLRVARNEADVYDSPILTIPTDGSRFEVQHAPRDETTGRSTGPREAKADTIALTKEEVLVFLEPGGVFTGVLVEFDETGTETFDGFVELLGSDWISVQAAMEATIELNESLVK